MRVGPQATVAGGAPRPADPLPGQAAVVIVSNPTADHLTEVVRGMCGVSVARLRSWTPAQVAAVGHGIQRAARRPVLLAGAPRLLTQLGLVSRPIMRLHSTQDPHTLTTPPMRNWPFVFTVWMSEYPR